jgi:hypothetical protein
MVRGQQTVMHRFLRSLPPRLFRGNPGERNGYVFPVQGFPGPVFPLALPYPGKHSKERAALPGVSTITISRRLRWLYLCPRR